MPDVYNSTRRDDTEEQEIPLFPEFRNIAEQSSEDRPLFWRDSPRAHLQEYIPSTAEYHICASTSPRIYFGYI